MTRGYVVGNIRTQFGRPDRMVFLISAAEVEKGRHSLGASAAARLATRVVTMRATFRLPYSTGSITCCGRYWAAW